MPKEIKKSPFPLLAMILAWLVPGSGHAYIGRPIRGLVIFITITATFWTGMAVGGALTVDCTNSRWWFYAQSLTGVNGLAGYYIQDRIYKDIAKDIGIQEQAIRRLPTDVLDQKLQEEGLALAHMPTENIARAYSGVAGMLNLLCIVDALMLSLMGVSGEPRRPQVGSEGKV